MKKIIVLISGRGSNFVAIEECAIAENWEQSIGAKIVAVISNRPGAKGLDLAKGYGIDAICVDHKAFESREAFEEKLAEVISQYEPDLIVLAGFMRILTAGFVDRFEGKILFQGTPEELSENQIVREKYLSNSFVLRRKDFQLEK